MDVYGELYADAYGDVYLGDVVVSVDGPYSVAAGQVYAAGSTAGEVFTAGCVAGAVAV